MQGFRKVFLGLIALCQVITGFLTDKSYSPRVDKVYIVNCMFRS